MIDSEILLMASLMFADLYSTRADRNMRAAALKVRGGDEISVSRMSKEKKYTLHRNKSQTTNTETGMLSRKQLFAFKKSSYPHPHRPHHPRHPRHRSTNDTYDE